MYGADGHGSKPKQTWNAWTEARIMVYKGQSGPWSEISPLHKMVFSERLSQRQELTRND